VIIFALMLDLFMHMLCCVMMRDHALMPWVWQPFCLEMWPWVYPVPLPSDTGMQFVATWFISSSRFITHCLDEVMKADMTLRLHMTSC